MWGAKLDGLLPIPRNMKYWNPPTIPAWSGPNAKEYPTTIQRIETTPIATRDWRPPEICQEPGLQRT